MRQLSRNKTRYDVAPQYWDVLPTFPSLMLPFFFFFLPEINEAF